MGIVVPDNQRRGGEIGVHPVMADETAHTSTGPGHDAGTEPSRRELSEAARRALAEADERRRARDAAQNGQPPETGGRAGPDPVRYGDWEKDGIISDF